VGEVIVDELSSGFYRYTYSEGDWHDAQTGYNSHAYFVLNTQNKEYDWGKWTPNLASTGPGNYAVYVYIPWYVTKTTNARYLIFHNGLSETCIINQANYSDQWVYLGTFYFAANGNEYIRLGDLTYESSLTKYVMFDAIKWVKQ